jgi:hypothetical protein
MAGEYHEAKKKQRDFESFLASLTPTISGNDPIPFASVFAILAHHENRLASDLLEHFHDYRLVRASQVPQIPADRRDFD